MREDMGGTWRQLLMVWRVDGGGEGGWCGGWLVWRVDGGEGGHIEMTTIDHYHI